MELRHSKLLIIGSGPAGYSAAIYAARANLQPILIEGETPGGQLTITYDVENYPGFAKAVEGPWLMEQMKEQAKHVGTQIINDHIKSVDFSLRPFKAVGESGNTYTADSVIICTGAQAKWLGLESEQNFKGYGVSGCATCDAFFFRNKEVMVVGGGNTALEEALYLTNHASRVYLIHRRNSFRAEKILQDRVMKHEKIEIIWDTELVEVLGENSPRKIVNGAKLLSIKDKIISEKKIDGIFIAIGHKPNTDLFRDQITLDEDAYIVTKPSTTQTNIKGVFAAGDVQDKIYRQAVTAAGTGCMAALEAIKYIDDIYS